LIKNKTLTAADLDHFLRSMGSYTGMNIASTGNTNANPDSTTNIAVSTSQNEQNPADDELVEFKPPQHGFEPDLPGKRSNATEDAALTLEQIAFGRSRAIGGGHNIPFFGNQHGSNAGRQLSHTDYHLANVAPGRSNSFSHSSPGASPGLPHQGQPARKSSLNVFEPRAEIGMTSSAPSSRPGSRSKEHEQGAIKAQPMIPSASNGHSGAGVGFGHHKRFVDSLSHEEKMARMDALLDLMDPTDLIDLFWTKTNVGWRYLIKVMPTADRAKFCVYAVSIRFRSFIASTSAG
jgi:hypothetical protein